MTITITIVAATAQEAQAQLLALAFPQAGRRLETAPMARLEPVLPAPVPAPGPAPAGGNGEAGTGWSVVPEAEAAERIAAARVEVTEPEAKPPEIAKRKPGRPPKAKPPKDETPPGDGSGDDWVEPEAETEAEEALEFSTVRAMLVKYHKAFDEESTAALLKLHGNGCTQLSKLSQSYFRKVYNAARQALPAE